MRITHSLLTAMLLVFFSPLFSQGNFWTVLEESSLASRSQERWIVPEKYSSFLLDATSMRSVLERVPERFNTHGETAIVHLPMPDGSLEEFAIVEAPLMHPDLAARYREIRTFSGQGITNPAAAAYLDWTPQGFHGMILMPGRAVYIDPYFKNDNTVYVSYDRDDYFNEKSAEFSCMTEGEGDTQYVPTEAMLPIEMNSRATTNMLTYRFAFAATGEYTAYHGGTVPLALAAINTTLNRVRGIYETELAISFTLISNNDLIVYTNPATDPYSSPPTLAENQSNTDAVIGTANYDVGHVISTGTGGVATLNGVCDSTKKARGMSASNNPKADPFDVDYVAHELGHQFSAHHTFNGSTGSCTASNRYAGTAFEPGSGSTIMSYAGLCGAAQNLQRRANAYFHLVSLGEITHYTTIGTGSTCPTSVASGNNIPTLNANPTGMSGKYIPISTPFELTATGSDEDMDELTYAWEEWDLGSQGAPSSSSTNAPVFRSFTPTSSPTRTFPILNDILDNSTSIGEKLPSVTRDLNINCTVRDNRTVGGGYGADGIVLHVTNAAGPFAITSHNTAATLNGAITVTWDVAGTTASPISCANVDILLSLDGGVTFSSLATATPNDGTQSVTLPNTATGNARIKVKCSDNVFFDINNADLRIAPSDATCSERVTDGNMSNYVNWTEYSSNGYYLISNWSSFFHNAIGSAWLGAVNNETSRLSQTITIPAGAHFANLEFWYRYDRTDCGGDVFNVKVNGSIVKSYNQCNDPGANDWTRQLIDLSAYVGTSPTIMFECITNTIYPSDVFIDDASVYVCTGGAFSPLPVELIAFEASADERNALLTWTTASESNNHGFEVEMQPENTGFQVVGFVPGQGTTSEITKYDFTVPGLKPSTYYFRLRQVDSNGSAKYSPIRSVVISGEAHVSVQPNPATDVAYFKVALEKEAQIQLQILDGLGRVVGTVVNDHFAPGNFDLAFSLNQLPEGIYYYRLVGNNIEETGRFSVNK